MTNEQLQNVLRLYPNDIDINIEQCGIYESGEIVNIRVDYVNDDNFEKPHLTIEYVRENGY